VTGTGHEPADEERSPAVNQQVIQTPGSAASPAVGHLNLLWGLTATVTSTTAAASDQTQP
jgi:hypothetical protein